MTAGANHVYPMLAQGIGLFISLRFVRATKFESSPKMAALTLGDSIFAFGLSVLFFLLHGCCPILTWMLTGACLAVLLVLWIDAALYGCFSFELGLSGIKDVVLSNLIAEVWSVGYARTFFAQHLRFVLLPFAWIGLLSLPYAADSRPGWRALCSCLSAYFLTTLWPSPELHAQSRKQSASPRRRSMLTDLCIPRAPFIPSGFVPRPQHATLLPLQRRPQSHSPLFGRLEGTSVIVCTFESLGACHLGEGKAALPFLASQRESPHALWSRHHVSPGPLTNAAHAAWYLDRFRAHPGSGADAASPLALLRQAGYQTIYLSATKSEHYGLRELLSEAGFAHIIDGSRLSTDVPMPAARDSHLLREGMQHLRSIVETTSGPYYLHVHAHNAHIPYLVEDALRFGRHDHKSDWGRFLCSQEETDAMFSSLIPQLTELLASHADNSSPVLLVLSSDHGQSFGEHGYCSHGTAVTNEQVVVPLCLTHPLLSRSSIDCSTHFDVLPTVLDLLGVDARAVHGQSVLSEHHVVEPMLFDGQPSRSSSGCLGLLLDGRKYSLDLVRDVLVCSAVDDQNRAELVGEERVYYEALIGLFARERGVL